MLKKLASDSYFSLINNLLQLLISLGSGIVIARLLGVKGKGEVYLIIQVYTMIQIVFSFGFGPALLFFLKQKEINHNQSNTFVILYSLAVTLLFYLLIFLFGTSIGNVFGGDISLKFLILSFLLALLNIASSLVGYVGMIEKKGVKWWNVTAFIGNLFYLISLVAFLFFFKLGTVGVIYALLISVAIKLILLMWPMFKLKFRLEKMNSPQIKKLCLFGFQIFISNIFLTSVFRIDTFFLNKMVSISQLGIYSVSVSVGELLLLIPNAIGFTLFPHLSGLEREEQRSAMCVVGRVSFIIGVVSIVGLALIGYPFILIVFGQKFISAFYPFLILLPGLLGMTLNYSYSNYFSSIGKPMLGAYIFCLGLIVNVILNIMLIPHFGIIAAALNSSIAYLVITVGFVVKITQEDSLSLRDFVFPQVSDFVYVRDKMKALISRK